MAFSFVLAVRWRSSVPSRAVPATPVLGHRRALDGLRGIAILLVLFGHLGIPTFDDGGGAGVTIFFVLSGFLITTILLEELDATGEIRLRRFFARRALRLVPALAVVVAVVARYTIAVLDRVRARAGLGSRRARTR